MAITVTNRGTFTHNTSATSFTCSPASNCTAGRIAICISADNNSSGGATNNITNVTDSLGNTWTVAPSTAVVFDNGAAAAGVQGSIWTTAQNAGLLQTSTTITVTLGTATTAKSGTLTQISSSLGTVSVRTSGAKSAGATGTAATLGASASVNVGEAILAAFFIEAGTTQTCTGDGDTTNGSWTALQYAEIGSTTSGNCCASQAKIQTTAASTQTYDVTLGISSDYRGAWVIFKEPVTFQRTVSVDGATAVDIDAFAGNLTFDVGAHGEVVQLFGDGDSPAQITFSPQASGSSIVAIMGGMDDLATQALTDNRSNVYTQIGATEIFSDWAGYGWTAKWKAGAVGGSGTILSQVVTLFDEISMVALELIGADVLEASSFANQANSGAGPTQLSGDVVTAGNAIVIALWGGAGPVGNGNHYATPNNGFRVLRGFGTDDPNGYVQFYLAYKIVSAGTHNVTWSHTPTQGAILGMWAFKAATGATTFQRAVAVDGSTALDAAAVRVVPRGATVDGATALDVVARRAVLRNVAVDGSTALDVDARRALMRNVAIDGATALDVIARRAVMRNVAVDGATQVDIDARRAVSRAVAVDGATAIDIAASRAILRSVGVDAATAIDIAANRVVQRAAAIDASTAIDIAAVRAVMRAIAVSAETQLEIIATNPGAGPQTHTRSVAVDASTAMDVAAYRAVLRSIAADGATQIDIIASRKILRSVAVDGATQLEVAASRAVLRSLSVDAPTSLDAAAHRAILRAIAIDAGIAVDIAASSAPGSGPQTHQRSIVVEAATLLEILAVRAAGELLGTFTNRRAQWDCTISRRGVFRATITRTE